MGSFEFMVDLTAAGEFSQKFEIIYVSSTINS